MDKKYYPAADSKANIYEIQEFLRYISNYLDGVRRVTPDGIYGPETRGAVADFQRVMGLPQTGEVNFETWTEIAETYIALQNKNKLPEKIAVYPIEKPFLKEGDVFEEIYVLQLMLRKLAGIYQNISSPDLTGAFDEKTKNSVSDFSKFRGGGEKSMVDRELWNAITNTYNSFTYNV